MIGLKQNWSLSNQTDLNLFRLLVNKVYKKWLIFFLERHWQNINLLV